MSFIEFTGGKVRLNKPLVNHKNIEYFGWVLVLSFVSLLLRISWRKWCDPQIDYGRELYIPWRMSEGAKWFKDVDDLYGPLSRFIDAGLFKIFGPGIMVLAWANIIVYVGILILIYLLFKRAWGGFAAFISLIVFVGVFSFSQLTLISNYNFVTPYSQQVTHGFLVCLSVVYLLPNWVASPTSKRSFWVGLMLGLTAVLKPEFVLASALVLGVAFFYRIKYYKVPSLKALAVGFLGSVLPTFAFFLLFTTYLPAKQAAFAASFAWLNGLFIWKDELTTHLLNNFSGLDQPKIHLLVHLGATGWALLIFGLIAMVGILTSYVRSIGLKLALGLLTTLIVVVIGIKGVFWINVGQSLFGLLSVYGTYLIWSIFIRNNSRDIEINNITKILLWMLAMALMTRMILNGRIFQYGFIQASLASIVIVAVILEELPQVFRIKGIAMGIYTLSVLSFLCCGVYSILERSKILQDAKTLSISHGSDLFYSFPKTVSGDGEIVKQFTEILSKTRENQTLVVVPEGIMINYLSRKKSPMAMQTYYMSKLLEEATLVDLSDKQPDWIIFMSRDLTEYGVKKFGLKGQSGELILNWILKHYYVTNSYGQDPLVGPEFGGILYRKK